MPLRNSLVSCLLGAVAAAFALGIPMWGQEASAPINVGGVQITGLPDDWTHHHFAFSNPGTEQDAIRNGTHDEWLMIVNDPRYIMQQLRRGAPAQGPAAEDVARIEEAARVNGSAAIQDATAGQWAIESWGPDKGKKPPPIKKDWSTPLGSGTQATGTFSFTAQPYDACTYGASWVNITGHPTNGGNDGYWFANTTCFANNYHGATDFDLVLISPNTLAQTIQNLQATINLNNLQCGYYYPTTTICYDVTFANSVLRATAVTPTSITLTALSGGTAGNAYTWAADPSNYAHISSNGSLSGGTNATVQPSAYPAVYVLNPITPSCSDLAIYPTGQAASASAANIIAYQNLYTGACSPAPKVYWAFNTGTGYAVTTSPIISMDGTKAAFVQSNGSSAQLVVVKWASGGGGTLGGPVTPTTSSNITSCTAPCMTVTSLTHNDTYSTPFYDFRSDDALYVGDDSGNLEKFTGVFNAAISVPTLASLNAVPYAISSPIYDSNSGCVFVGDTQGYLYSVSSGVAGTVCTGSSFALFGRSKLLGNGSANAGIFDGPLVDPNRGKLYVFVAASGTSIGNCTTGQNCVDEFAVGTITSGSTTAAPTVTEALGTGGATYNLYIGNFDNVFYSSSTGTGSLYALGNTSVAGGGTLYRVTVTSGSMTALASAVTGLNSTVRPWPSPATEFCNNGTNACVSDGTKTTSGNDYLFFSVNSGAKTGCTSGAGNGCILSYNISNFASATQAGSGLNVITPGTNGCWATGGFVIDNSSASAGASQIYFVNLNGAAAGGTNGTSYTSSNCTTGAGPTIQAVQASQANP